MKKKIFTSKVIAGTGILMAIEIVLQIIGSLIAPTGVAINLALIPITFGAMIYGPVSGLILGFVNGVVVLLSPTTSVFYDQSIIGTIIVCLTKCSIAGLASGFIFKSFKKRKVLGSVVTALVLPVINTSIFALLALIFFKDMIASNSNGSISNPFLVILIVLVGWNFIGEVLFNILLIPPIYKLIEKKIARASFISTK